jgi:dihydrofolate reductase
MRKIINSTYISLDGVIEAPHTWPPTGEDEASGAMHTDLILSCDAVLMGRRTYEGFAAAWPTRSGDPYSDRINSIRKYVVSSSLEDPFFVGDGGPEGLIYRDAPTAMFELRDATPLKSGIVVLTYAAAS